MKLAAEIFDFFLPRLCFACGEKLSINDKILCPACFASLTKVPQDRMVKEFKRKFENDKVISGFASLFMFESEGALQKVIHELKYSKKFALGKYLGELITENLKFQINEFNPNIILPVPIHRLRKAERGFNQSYYIAKGIGKKLQVPVRPNLLKRKRYTETQTALSMDERKINVAEAFVVTNKKLIAGKRFLMIDDVITTGSTITECGRKLLESGADKIFAVSVGLAQ